MTTTRTKVASTSELISSAEAQAALRASCNDILTKHQADQVKRTIPTPYHGNRPVIRSEGVPDIQSKPSTVWLARSGPDSFDLILIGENRPIGVPIINRPDAPLPDLSPSKEYVALKLGLGLDYEDGIGLFGWNGIEWELMEGLDQAAEGGQSDAEIFAEICIFVLEGSTTERSTEPLLIPSLGSTALTGVTS